MKKKKKKRKNRLNGYVHNVPVDYDDIDISGITDIYKYLMKKHNILIYVYINQASVYCVGVAFWWIINHKMYISKLSTVYSPNKVC